MTWNARNLMLAILAMANEKHMNVAVCVIPQTADDEFSSPQAAKGKTDLATNADASFAQSKALTVQHWWLNTTAFKDQQSDAAFVSISQSAGFPFFCPWDGGIKVYDAGGFVVACVGVHGAETQLANRRLAVAAARSLGFGTDFTPEGYIDEPEAYEANAGYVPE